MQSMDVKKWLRTDGLKLGTILSIDHPAIAEIAGLAGFDWIWVDAEHGRFNELSAATACAVNAGRLPTFVRLPDQSSTAIKRYLDIGCDGIILPMVSSASQVDEIARAALYAPRGERSVGIARAHGYGARFAEYLQQQDYAIVVQIETVSGLENADEIASHPAVDAVIIGPFDLSASFGIPGQIENQQVVEGIDTVQKSCRRHGKPCGIFAATADKARQYVQSGFEFIGVGIDCSVLLSGFSSLCEAIRKTGNWG
jgi:2-keto-3-deoxy-L-rhamnonate aldolase RhmA